MRLVYADLVISVLSAFSLIEMRTGDRTRKVEKSYDVNTVTLGYEQGIKDAVSVLHDVPTIEAEPVKHGKWIMRGGKFRCSECDEKALKKDIGGTGGFSHEYEQVKSDFCPNCGARMDGLPLLSGLNCKYHLMLKGFLEIISH